jgi:hypothetical protein
MSEHESRREADDRDDEDQEVGSAAPPDEGKVVGEGADVPAGEGEEAGEAGVEGGQDSPQASGERDDGERDDGDRDDGERQDDDRDELAREIESDPSSNPEDPMLKDIKGG